MAKISKSISTSNLHFYPSSNARKIEYKVNSESNITGITRKLIRNQIISGFKVNKTSSLISVTGGEGYIGGYRFSIPNGLDAVSVDMSLYDPDVLIYVYFTLKRNSSKSTIGDIEVEVGDVSEASGTSATNYDFGGLVLEASDEVPNLEDSLILAIFTNKGEDKFLSQRSNTKLRAQDIYVEGTDVNDPSKSDTPEPQEDSHVVTPYHKSCTLDEFLSLIDTNDGQF